MKIRGLLLSAVATLAVLACSDGESGSNPAADGGSGGAVGPGGSGGASASTGGGPGGRPGGGGISSTAGAGGIGVGGATGGAGGTNPASGGASAGGMAGTGGAPVEPPPPTCDGTSPATNDLGTTPGVVDLPWPTMRHLTVVWPITGDTNENGVVTVRYRAVGATAWRGGPPLRRVPAGNTQGFSWTNKHAGSLFGLDPATTYEVEVTVLDPDGGCEIQVLQATTRAVPRAVPGASVVPVTPSSFAAALGAVDPGDVLELAPGSYAGFTVNRDGTSGSPIVIRAASTGVTVTGDVRIDGRSHVLVQGLTVQGQIKFNAGVGISVVGCTVQANEDGIVMRTRGENAYIADNVVTGVTAWTEPALGASGANLGEGILVTGPGHVIEHNRVTGFRDGVSLLEDTEAVDQFSIDVLDNDIYEAADDGVEADFCFHDCRIAGNRLTNVFIALSSQPGLGGPTYFVRNAVYSAILSAFKLQRGSVGDVLWHNTVVKNGDALGIYTTDVFSRQLFRNNLLLGGPGGDYNGYSSGSGDVVSLDAAGTGVDLDYDAFGSTLGTFEGRIGNVSFASLSEMRARTTEVHGVEAALDVFASTVPYPASPFPAAAPPDLRPAAGSVVVDAAVAIPGVNDGYAGLAPDIGAYELGDPLPVYGPRP